MKILFRGVPDKDKNYDVVCRGCLSHIQFMKHEAKIVDDRNETCYVIKCPVCCEEIQISNSALSCVSSGTDFRDMPFYPK